MNDTLGHICNRIRFTDHSFFIQMNFGRGQAMGVLLVLFFVFWSPINLAASGNATAIRLDILDDHVVIDNGMLQLNISKPEGKITGIAYGGITNLLATNNSDLNGAFYDHNWSPAGSKKTRGKFDNVVGNNFSVIVENEEQVELSFKRIWDPSQMGKISPLNIDKRFIVLRNNSGFYSYAIFEHTENMPAFNLNTARIAFMLNGDKFHYMVVADNIQRYMPDADDRLPSRGERLAYQEAVRFVKPLESNFTGEVDDKYEYSKENKDNKVHGWISFDPPVGFWQITPSNEFRSGGPFKQDLTSHVNPSTLAIFATSHYAGLDLVIKVKAGEVWKKVFGPVFTYLNSVPDNSTAHTLWDNAKEQMNVEVESWPYNFTTSDDFPKSDQRGMIYGRLLVKDSYISNKSFIAKGAYVGLAPRGHAGSWQLENKGYQFWTTTNRNGYFILKNIRAGQYNIFASVPGFVGDYVRKYPINITAGSAHHIVDLLYEPPRDGPTLWEIGIPDRSAKEFYVPDPNPLYINKLFINHTDRFRQYGLWERYAELYPGEDLVYTIGRNNYSKDWFFAQVTRKIGNETYNGTTWQIKFELENIAQYGTYTLRLALASAHASELQVRVNDLKTTDPLFSTGKIGKDNAIARHGIHGIYWLFNVSIPSTLLVTGNNTIYLTQTMSTSPFQGIMYDYIRLEGP